MINSKIEKLIYVLVLLGIICALFAILPFSEDYIWVEKLIVFPIVFILEKPLYRHYIYLRNKHILNRIDTLLRENQFERALEYADRCLNNHKKDFGIHSYKLYTLAMCGQVTKFEETISEYSKSMNFKKVISMDFVKALEKIIRYIKSGKCEEGICLNDIWGQIIGVLSENDPEKSISDALNIYGIQYSMIKCVLAYSLSLNYFKLKDSEKSEYYYKEAVSYAPSSEILYYIQNNKLDMQSLCGPSDEV